MWIKTSLVDRRWKLKREGILIRVIVETGGGDWWKRGETLHILLGRTVCFLYVLLPVLVKCLVFPYGYP